jgi:N-hydroxyarylamine O-acetyltransferase
VDRETAAAYAQRFDAALPAALDAASLRDLHRAHLLAVPFENLSIHLGEQISLAEPDLVDKIVRRRRGGFCYELNGLFALLLESLGASVTRVAARVHGDDGFGPPFDHLALIVAPADGSGPWLADVGFGSHTVYPLALETGGAQHDPAGEFSITVTADGDLDVRKEGKPQYRVETRARDLTDFVPTCWYQQSSPASHFTQGTICSRLTEHGRLSIAGSLLIETRDGTRTERPLDGPQALLAAYREHFGVVLDRAPAGPAAS